MMNRLNRIRAIVIGAAAGALLTTAAIARCAQDAGARPDHASWSLPAGPVHGYAARIGLAP